MRRQTQSARGIRRTVGQGQERKDRLGEPCGSTRGPAGHCAAGNTRRTRASASQNDEGNTRGKLARGVSSPIGEISDRALGNG